MKLPLRNEKARRQPGVFSKANITEPKAITKLQRIVEILHRPEGLNRFEAESYGDHCLNSTVADIRAIYGNKLIQRWEIVPSRFSSDGVRVLRYWLTEGSCNATPTR